jgi:hypothetical protein
MQTKDGERSSGTIYIHNLTPDSYYFEIAASLYISQYTITIEALTP